MGKNPKSGADNEISNYYLVNNKKKEVKMQMICIYCSTVYYFYPDVSIKPGKQLFNLNKI